MLQKLESFSVFIFVGKLKVVMRYGVGTKMVDRPLSLNMEPKILNVGRSKQFWKIFKFQPRNLSK